MTTGEKLQKLRKENKYTQEELADVLGVSRQSISKWESDSAFPETDKLIVLSNLFNCSIDYLLIKDYKDEAIEKESNISRKKDKKRLPLLITSIVFMLFSLFCFAMPWAKTIENYISRDTTEFISFFDFLFKSKVSFCMLLGLFIMILAIVCIVTSVLNIALDQKELFVTVKTLNYIFSGVIIAFYIAFMLIVGLLDYDELANLKIMHSYEFLPFFYVELLVCVAIVFLQAFFKPFKSSNEISKVVKGNRKAFAISTFSLSTLLLICFEALPWFEVFSNGSTYNFYSKIFDGFYGFTSVSCIATVALSVFILVLSVIFFIKPIKHFEIVIKLFVSLDALLIFLSSMYNSTSFSLILFCLCVILGTLQYVIKPFKNLE